MIFDISFGSLIQTEPDSQHLSKTLQSEWHIISNSSIRYKIIEERFIDRRDRIFYYIDSYSDLFSEKVVSDAKRMVFSTNIKVSPHLLAISSLFFSSEINGLNIKKNFRFIIERTNELNNRSNITLGKTLMKNIRHYSELIRNENKNKIELLKTIP